PEADPDGRHVRRYDERRMEGPREADGDRGPEDPELEAARDPANHGARDPDDRRLAVDGGPRAGDDLRGAREEHRDRLQADPADLPRGDPAVGGARDGRGPGADARARRGA